MQKSDSYENKGSESLHGKTWNFVERTPFAGEVVDYSNKRKIIEREARAYKEKNPQATALECLMWGRRYVNKEQKHYRAYLKGNNSYMYKGTKYLVEDLQRKMVFERINQELAEKFKKESEKISEEE